MMDAPSGESSLGLTDAALSPGLATDTLGAAFELKYHITSTEADFVEQWARRNLSPDCHGDGGVYRVTSVYCDTPHYDVFHRTDGYKRRKYRVRRYGDGETIFLERKSKNGDRVRKRRVQVAAHELSRLDETLTDLEWTGAWFHQRLLRRSLRPAARVSYVRTAFFGHVGNTPVRLTIDRNLVGAPADDWNLTSPFDGHPLLDGEALMEMKFHISMPELFKDLLPHLPTSPARLSKYRRCVHLCKLASPIILPGPHEQHRIAAS
jgi:hypothetical protein